MARKVFISFLGSNNYLETYYSFEGKKSEQPVRFIQEDLVKRLCNEWTKDDRILIFCTDDSKTKNWLNDGHGDEKLEGLEYRLKSLKLPIQIEMTEISEGFSEEEIWSIFNSVYGKLQEEDEIYFDVTHSFRSIPLFSTILFNYAHYLKRTNLVGVYYGAFEKLGPAYMVRHIPVEERIAPIIDLTSIVRLQELTSAANNLHQYGKMSTLSDLISVVEGKGKVKQDVNCIKKKMKEFDLAISTCKLDVIKDGKLIGELQERIKAVKEIPTLSQAHRELIAKVENEINVFKPIDTYENVETAVDWARKYGMIQQAYTLAEELTISKVKDFLLPKYEILRTEDNKMCRVFISALLSLDIKREEYKNEKKDLKCLFYELLSLEIIKELRPYYMELANNRNIINHAKKTDKDLVKEFDKKYDKIREILSDVH
ncbi:TIGR02221 family CRISPR-associated protein [Prevotella pallens]|jgi:CRISPR-associated protein, TM1812 family|uniref:TIGR02221 family CRISPR-associated protein n=1 Tax=Prevotella pallens TaxID=60133 RepID=UPI001CB39A5F|nr:TIGR02221 family CRISPR-associated protein [Prevotella pallens]MBF1473397.1 TIGR02221 family CRISPR-associated protein [Prevotella pallens]MBF1477130.1 TIGR02221 family CRISPR-associated protein [Prevotella pallens]MBF1518154.1 TIGR02221 family CRISPR-associated protein [Prevotella pallens]